MYMDETKYLKKYPHTKRKCTVCEKLYSYKYRQRKRTGKTCSHKCAKALEKETRKNYHKRWFQNQKERKKRNTTLNFLFDNLYKLNTKELELIRINVEARIVRQQWREKYENNNR